MHRQIGNAVPLPVAHALGRELRKVLYNKWKANLDEAIWIDDEDGDGDDVDGGSEHLGIAETSDGDRMDTD
jgi:hypothetical protein